MNRVRAILLLGLVVTLAAASTAAGRSTQPVLRRPNPLFVSIGLDYVNPITLPNGTVVTSLVPLGKGAISASVRDLQYLAYERRDDLGGFLPAPLGWLATGNCYPPKAGVVCPGTPLGAQFGKSGVPFYTNQANTKIQSYTYLHGIGGQGKNCVACGITPPIPFISGAPVYPANGGFGGQTTTPTQTTTTPASKGGGGKKVTAGGAGDCGTAGISIVSNLPHCRIYVVNQAPGDGTFEQMTITNTTNVTYVLSFKATGTPNQLWQDLTMGVWEKGTPAPTPLPPLHFWTDQYTDLITLGPGQVVHYTIELYLPLSAGNADQDKTAVIDFDWRAAQKTG